MSCLDMRHLPAPEPMLRALAESEALAGGGTLELLLPQWLAPLLQLLQVRGFETSADLLHDGSARVRVRRP